MLKFQRPGPAAGLSEAAEHVVAASCALPTEAEHELVRRCFDQDTLSKLIGLRETISSGSAGPWTSYLKWALLGTLRDVASVKVGWPYQRPSLVRSAPHRHPSKRFLQRTHWMAEDLGDAPASLGSRVIAGDSRQACPWLEALGGQLADACIASPPYLNNFDYADATRLELYFWGTARSWKEMCDTVRLDMIIATTQQTRKGLAKDAMEQLGSYSIFDEYLRPIVKRLEEERGLRKGAKEYDRVIAPYFLGLAGVLNNLFEALRSEARCTWLIGDSAPYGVYIDTPAIVGSLAVDLGFELVDDLKVRQRGQRWRSSGMRHNMKLTERLITFLRP